MDPVERIEVVCPCVCIRVDKSEYEACLNLPYMQRISRAIVTFLLQTEVLLLDSIDWKNDPLSRIELIHTIRNTYFQQMKYHAINHDLVICLCGS